MPPLPLVAVVGATATGKSDLAVDLALELDGEVVGADAMQLYRGMDIGTAKITAAERRGVPHHLLDVLDVREEASVSAYQAAARAAIAAIRSRGRVPILAGGSGLYVRAVLDDIAFPPTDAAVRERWEDALGAQGAPALHRLLRERDPGAAEMIGAHDARRIVRALEVGELTGKGFRAFLPQRLYRDPITVQIGVHRDRAALHERITRRVDLMIERGLLEETRRLRERGLDQGPTARRAIGYEQALAVLDGTMTCQQAREATIAGTRRLVRKQDTWFRRDPRVAWIGTEGAPESESAERRELLGGALAVLREREAHDEAPRDDMIADDHGDRADGSGPRRR